MPDHGPLFNTKNAAEYLGLQEQTLANWRCNYRQNPKKAPHYVKFGSRILYEKTELDRFIEENRVNY